MTQAALPRLALALRVARQYAREGNPLACVSTLSALIARLEACDDDAPPKDRDRAPAWRTARASPLTLQGADADGVIHVKHSRPKAPAT